MATGTQPRLLVALLLGLASGRGLNGCTFDRAGIDPSTPAGTDASARDGSPVQNDGGPADAGPPGCGNSVREGAEECDGPDFGTQTCQNLGFDGGFLTCRPNCTLDTGGCFGGPEWPCRIPVTVGNQSNSSALTGYQVWFQLPYQPQMNPDFSDLRVGNAALTEQHPYWIETVNPSASTGVWVRVPAVPANGSAVIYAHYGNAAAQYTGDPEAVFEFFDDFESGVGKWVQIQGNTPFYLDDQRFRSGTHSLRTDQVYQQLNVIVARSLNVSDIAFECWWYLDNTDTDLAQFVRSSGESPLDHYETSLEPSGGWDIAEENNGSWTELVPNRGAATLGAWIKVTVIVVGSRIKVLIDNVQTVPGSGWTNVGPRLGSGTVGLRSYIIRAGAHWWMDDARVRKAADPEPTVTVGQPECFPY